MSELEHERWMADRLEAGRWHGPVKDDAERLHPSLVPWSELPEERREIDRDLVRERPAMLARAGKEIYPA